jgi:hypothetical protein
MFPLQEIFAVDMENRLRSYLGMPLREKYLGVTLVIDGKRVYDDEGNQIPGGGVDYILKY